MYQAHDQCCTNLLILVGNKAFATSYIDIGQNNANTKKFCDRIHL